MKLETLEYKRLARMAPFGDASRHRLPKLANLTASLASARGRVAERARGKQLTRVAPEVGSRCDRVHSSGDRPRQAGAGCQAIPNAGDRRLLTTARSVAADAPALRAAFLAPAMSPNFLDVLNEHIQEFERSRTDYAAAVRERDDMEAQIETATQDARPEAKRLDAIVRNALRKDPTALVAWDKACPFGRARVSRHSDAVSTTRTLAKTRSVALEVTWSADRWSRLGSPADWPAPLRDGVSWRCVDGWIGWIGG